MKTGIKTIILILVAGIAILIQSCSEGSVNPWLPGGNGNNIKTGQYFPHSLNSKWSYIVSLKNGKFLDSIYVSIIDTLSDSINGAISVWEYKYYLSPDQPQQEMINIKHDSVFSFSDMILIRNKKPIAQELSYIMPLQLNKKWECVSITDSIMGFFYKDSAFVEKIYTTTDIPAGNFRNAFLIHRKSINDLMNDDRYYTFVPYVGMVKLEYFDYSYNDTIIIKLANYSIN